MKKIMLFIVFFLFLTACGAAPVAPTGTAAPPTLTLAPSNTPLPSETPTPAFTPTVTPDSSIHVDGKGVDMRLVPAGEFTMGMSVADALDQCKKYRPVNPFPCQTKWFEGSYMYQVSLDAFYIDTYEVTNALYKACVTDGACKPPKPLSSFTHPEYYGNPQYDNYPVIYVNWDKAKTYCEWRGASLPTEAQWEKAARGTDGRVYPWGNKLEDGQANFCTNNCRNEGTVYSFPDDGFADVAPVGSFEKDKSPYGVYDMLGNVAEWTADVYSTTYKKSPAAKEPNPTGPESGTDRVIKGGSWYSPPELTFMTIADFQNHSSNWYAFGFRCASPAP